MKLKTVLLFIAALASTQSFCSTDVMWVKLDVNRTYRDADVNCFGVTAKGQLLFSAEVEDGIVKVAQVQNYPNVWPFSAIYRSLELSPKEVQSIKIYKDKQNRWWLTRLELSDPTLRWTLYESAKSYSHCPAPQPMATVSPAGFSFTFETEGLEEGIWISESNKTNVSGTRKDGNPYTGSVQMTQKEFKDGF